MTNTQNEFTGAVVVTTYGAKRTYRVTRVNFQFTPKTHYFTQGEGSAAAKISMLQYFQTQYGVKLTDPDQPLFEVEQKRGTIYLPPELCQMIGIPTEVRRDFRAMLDVKKAIFLRPDEKVGMANGLTQLIAESKTAKEWDLQLSVDPDQIEANILPRPYIIDPYKKPSPEPALISLEENPKKTLGSVVHQPLELKLIFVCCERDANDYAAWSFEQMQKAIGLFKTGQKFSLDPDNPTYVQLHNQATSKDFADAIKGQYDAYLKQDLEGKGKKPHITARSLWCIVVILPHKEDTRNDQYYKDIKDKIN
jgi:hypothetical protein